MKQNQHLIRDGTTPYGDVLTETNLTQRQADIWALRKYAALSRTEVADAIGVTPNTVDRHWATVREHISTAELLTDITTHYNDPAGDPTTLSKGTYQHQPIRVSTTTWTDESALPIQSNRIDWFHELDTDSIAVRKRTAVESNSQSLTREAREVYDSFSEAVCKEYHERADASLFELAARWKAATEAQNALADTPEIDTDGSIPTVTDTAVIEITLRDVFRVIDAGVLTKREAATTFETDDNDDALEIMSLPDGGKPTNIEQRTLVDGTIDEFLTIQFDFLELVTSATALFSMTSDPVIADAGGDYIVDITYRLWRAGFERGVESTYPVRLPSNDALAIGSSLAINYHLSPDAPSQRLYEQALKSIYQQMPPEHQSEIEATLTELDSDLSMHEPPEDGDAHA